MKPGAAHQGKHSESGAREVKGEWTQVLETKDYKAIFGEHTVVTVGTASDMTPSNDVTNVTEGPAASIFRIEQCLYI
jgi:hypothetical protein